MENIIKWIKGDAKEDAKHFLLCMLCSNSLYPTTHMNTTLRCGHVIHTSCLNDFASTRGQEVIAETTQVHDFGVKRLDKLACPICKEMTKLPSTGLVDSLPKKYTEEHFPYEVEKKLIITYKPRSGPRSSQPPSVNTIEYIDDRYDMDDYGAGSPFDPPSKHGPFSGSFIERNMNLTESHRDMSAPDMRALFSDSNTTDNNLSSYATSNPKVLTYDVNYSNSQGDIPTTVESYTNSIQNSVGNGIGKLQYDGKPAEQKSRTSSDKQPSSVDQMYGEICCREHRKSSCTLFCEVCSVPICAACSSKNHQGHVINDIYEQVDQWQKKIVQMQKTIAADIKNQRLWEKQILTLHMQQKDTCKKMKEDIQRHTNQIILKINHQCQRLITTLECHSRSQQENFERASKFMKYNTDCSENLRLLTTRLLSDPKNGEAKMLLNYKTLKWRVENHLDDVKYSKQYVNQLRQTLAFHPKEDILAVKLGLFSKAKYDLPEETEGDDQPIQIPEKPKRKAVQLHTSPQLKWDHVFPLNEKTSCGAHGTLFLPDDSLLVAYHGRNTIVRFRDKNRQSKLTKDNIDKHFRLQDTDSTEGIQRMEREQIMPLSMTMIDANTFAVTDNRKFTVRIFNTQGVQVHKMGDEFLRCHRKNSEDQPNGFSPTNPTGIAKLHDDKIAVSDTIHNRVYIIDLNTEQVVTKFGERGRNNIQFDKPEFLTFDKTRNRIIVSDQKNHMIKLFDVNGQFIHAFGHPKDYKKRAQYQDGSESDEFDGLNQPCGVVCDYHGNILVTNGYHHNICRFNYEGRFMSIINVYEGSRKCLLSWPCGIDLGRQGQMALTEKTSGKVSVIQTYH